MSEREATTMNEQEPRQWVLGDPNWKHEGHHRLGDVIRWRGVRLVCGIDHFAGHACFHPWDAGWGWHEQGAAKLWTPLGRRDRWLLRVVGRRTRGALASLRETHRAVPNAGGRIRVGR